MKSPVGSTWYFWEVVLLPDVHVKSWHHNQSKWSSTSQGTITIPVLISTAETVLPENITVLLLPPMDLERLFSINYIQLQK